MKDSLLTQSAPKATAAGRFTLGRAAALAEPGERVALGADRKGAPFIVYAYGAAMSGIPLAAYATALVHLTTAEQIVATWADAGALDKLAAAVVKAGAAAKLPAAPK